MSIMFRSAAFSFNSMRSNTARLFRRSTLRGSIAAPVRRTLSTKSFGFFDTFLPKYARLIEKNFPRTGKRSIFRGKFNLAAAICETEKELGTNYSSIAIAGTPAHLAFGLLRWDTVAFGHGTQRTKDQYILSWNNYATTVQRPDGTSDVVGNTVLLSDKVVRHTEEVASTGTRSVGYVVGNSIGSVVGYMIWLLPIATLCALTQT